MFSLPEAILVDILSFWCDLGSLLRFDSGLCSHRVRNVTMLSSVGRSSEFFLNSEMLKAKLALKISGSFINSFYPWVCSRKVALNAFQFDSSLVSFHQLNFNLTKIDSLSFIGTEFQVKYCIDLINSCLVLRSLCFKLTSDLHDSIFDQINISRLAQLRHLSIVTGSDGISQRTVSKISAHCFGLEGIQLEISCAEDWSEAAFKLIRNNAAHLKLLKVTVALPSHFFVDVLPLLIVAEDVRLVSCDVDHATTIGETIAYRLPRLKNLFVGSHKRSLEYKRDCGAVVGKMIEMRGSGVAGDDLNGMFGALNDIATVSLCSCSNLSSDLFTSVGKNINLALRKLTLSECDGLETCLTGLTSLFSVAAGLECVELKACDSLSVQNCKDLFRIPNSVRHLFVSRHAGFRMEDANDILELSPRLKKVTLSECPNVEIKQRGGGRRGEVVFLRMF